MMMLLNIEIVIELFSYELFWKLIDEYSVTIILLVPSMTMFLFS